MDAPRFRPSVKGAAHMAKRILVIDADDRGQFFLSVDGGTVTIGDSPGHADGVLRNLRVARIHCEVEVEEGLVVVSPPPGASGKSLGGRPLHPGESLLV